MTFYQLAAGVTCAIFALVTNAQERPIETAIFMAASMIIYALPRKDKQP